MCVFRAHKFILENNHTIFWTACIENLQVYSRIIKQSSIRGLHELASFTCTLGNDDHVP